MTGTRGKHSSIRSVTPLPMYVCINLRYPIRTLSLHRDLLT
jgi:hypothetical protein